MNYEIFTLSCLQTIHPKNYQKFSTAQTAELGWPPCHAGSPAVRRAPAWRLVAGTVNPWSKRRPRNSRYCTWHAATGGTATSTSSPCHRKCQPRMQDAAIPRIAQTPLLVWTFQIGFRDNGGNIGTRSPSQCTTKCCMEFLKTPISRTKTRNDRHQV